MRKELGKSRKGQGLTEYIIIVALVAIAGIGIVNIFGNQLQEPVPHDREGDVGQPDENRRVARGQSRNGSQPEEPFHLCRLEVSGGRR